MPLLTYQPRSVGGSSSSNHSTDNWNWHFDEICHLKSISSAISPALIRLRAQRTNIPALTQPSHTHTHPYSRTAAHPHMQSTPLALHIPGFHSAVGLLLHCFLHYTPLHPTSQRTHTLRSVVASMLLEHVWVWEILNRQLDNTLIVFATHQMGK